MLGQCGVPQGQGWVHFGGKFTNMFFVVILLQMLEKNRKLTSSKGVDVRFYNACGCFVSVGRAHLGFILGSMLGHLGTQFRNHPACGLPRWPKQASFWDVEFEVDFGIAFGTFFMYLSLCTMHLCLCISASACAFGYAPFLMHLCYAPFSYAHYLLHLSYAQFLMHLSICTFAYAPLLMHLSL